MDKIEKTEPPFQVDQKLFEGAKVENGLLIIGGEKYIVEYYPNGVEGGQPEQFRDANDIAQMALNLLREQKTTLQKEKLDGLIIGYEGLSFTGGEDEPITLSKGAQEVFEKLNNLAVKLLMKKETGRKEDYEKRDSDKINKKKESESSDVITLKDRTPKSTKNEDSIEKTKKKRKDIDEDTDIDHRQTKKIRTDEYRKNPENSNQQLFEKDFNTDPGEEENYLKQNQENLIDLGEKNKSGNSPSNISNFRDENSLNSTKISQDIPNSTSQVEKDDQVPTNQNKTEEDPQKQDLINFGKENEQVNDWSNFPNILDDEYEYDKDLQEPFNQSMFTNENKLLDKETFIMFSSDDKIKYILSLEDKDRESFVNLLSNEDKENYVLEVSNNIENYDTVSFKQSELEKYGFSRTPVKADGNCFFNSIYYLMEDKEKKAIQGSYDAGKEKIKNVREKFANVLSETKNSTIIERIHKLGGGRKVEVKEYVEVLKNPPPPENQEVWNQNEKGSKKSWGSMEIELPLVAEVYKRPVVCFTGKYVSLKLDEKGLPNFNETKGNYIVEGENYSDTPIYIFYNGGDHFDPLILQQKNK